MRQHTRGFTVHAVSFISLAIISAACAPPDTTTEAETAPAVDTAAEEAAIMALEREWSSRFGAGDVEWIVDIHAAEAVQLPPDAPLVAGTEAMRAAWEGMAATLEASWEPTFARVSPDGNMAYDYGTASLTLPDGSVQSMKYLVVWIREDGEWKVAADMFNANEAY
jgi:ketosteroid isomerase-like protein